MNKTVDWQMPSPTRVGKALLSRRGIALDRTPNALGNRAWSAPALREWISQTSP